MKIKEVYIGQKVGFTHEHKSHIGVVTRIFNAESENPTVEVETSDFMAEILPSKLLGVVQQSE